MKTAVLLVSALAALLAAPPAYSQEDRGGQFLGFTTFSNFVRSAGEHPGETVLTSKEIPTRIAWDELIASWNLDPRAGTWLKAEVRALYPDRATKYYTMGLYSADPALHPRSSVAGQKDADGKVSTDTLALQALCRRMQVRLTLGGSEGADGGLKFFSLCLTDSKASPPPLPANQAAWGWTIEVPQRSQMAYPNGKVLCVPPPYPC
jgi:hypothetical protein